MQVRAQECVEVAANNPSSPGAIAPSDTSRDVEACQFLRGLWFQARYGIAEPLAGADN